MDFKNLKKKIHKPKVWRLLPNVCDLHKKIHRLGYRFKNLQKIYRLAYGFLFFMIPISGVYSSFCSNLARLEPDLNLQILTNSPQKNLFLRRKSQRKKIHRLAYRFSIDFKIYRLAYGFLCVNHKGLAKVYRFLVRAFFSQDFKNPQAGMDFPMDFWMLWICFINVSF